MLSLSKVFIWYLLVKLTWITGCCNEASGQILLCRQIKGWNLSSCRPPFYQYHIAQYCCVSLVLELKNKKCLNILLHYNMLMQCIHFSGAVLGINTELSGWDSMACIRKKVRFDNLMAASDPNLQMNLHSAVLSFWFHSYINRLSTSSPYININEIFRPLE